MRGTTKHISRGSREARQVLRKYEITLRFSEDDHEWMAIVLTNPPIRSFHPEPDMAVDGLIDLILGREGEQGANS